MPLASAGRTNGIITTNLTNIFNLKWNLAKAYASGMQKIERIRVEIVAVVRLNRNALTISGLDNDSARFIDFVIKINPMNG